jgi:hypothetical protein
VSFRVFQSDQEVKDPSSQDVEALAQDRIYFLLREGQLVYLRRGNLDPEETRVLLENVHEANFSAGSSYKNTGALGGLLRVTLRMLQPGGATQLVREIGIPVGIPVLEVGAVVEGEFFLPPPHLPDSSYNR